MADRLHVDPMSLEGIADQPPRSADDLRAAAGDAPEAPDAGADTPIFNELLVRLGQTAPGPTGGPGAASERVTQAHRTYAAEDAGNTPNLDGGR